MKSELKMDETMEEVTLTPEQKEKRLRFLSALLLAVAVSFSFCVYDPLEGFLSNSADFWFDLPALIPAMAIMFVAVFAIVFLLTRYLPKKASAIVSAVIFAVTIGAYIEYNFLVSGYPIMNGDEINWSSLAYKGTLSIIIWAVLIIGFVIFAILKGDIFRKVVVFVSILLTGALLVSAVSLFITKPPAEKSDVGLSTQNMYDLSKDENILVVVSDTFESSYFARALADDPTLADDFKDFIYYHDTTGVSTFTNLSMPLFFTGKDITLGDYSSTLLKNNYDTTDFFDYMHNNGYDVRYYTWDAYTSDNEEGKVDNAVKASASSSVSATARVSELMYKFSMFKWMPHYLKQFFMVDTADFSAAQSLTGVDVYVQDDLKFYNDLDKTGFDGDTAKKQLVMYHLKGVHAPYKTDRNFNAIQYDASTPLEDRRYEKSLAQVKTFKEIIKKLKDAGKYDDTTIIITADHGNLQRFNPIFLVKPKNADAAFRESTAQVSVLEDYIPTIKALAAGKDWSETAIGSLSETAKRTRTVYNYNFATSYGTRLTSKSTIEVSGKAYDDSSYTVVSDKFASLGDKSKYTLGSEISMTPEATNASVWGIHDDATAGCDKYTYTKTARVEVQFDKTPTDDMTVTLGISKVWYKDQRLVITVGGETVFSDTIAQNTKGDITFKIPAKLLDGDKLDIDFEFPDRVKDPNDEETLGSIFEHAFNFGKMSIK